MGNARPGGTLVPDGDLLGQVGIRLLLLMLLPLLLLLLLLGR